MNKKQPAIMSIDQRIIDAIVQTLLSKGGLQIRGFGIFKLQKMKKNNGANLGKQKKLAPYVKMKFQPTKQLKIKIQKYK